MRKSVCFAVAAAACLGAFGANVYWSNTGTGSWTTMSNWQGGALPGTADTAINDSGGTILFSDGMTQTVNLFHTGTASGKSGHLQITGGSLTLKAIASQIGSKSGGSGTVEMTGGELHVAQFQVGAYGTGSMTLSGGTVYSTDWCCIGRYVGGVGTLTITGNGLWECQKLGVFASEQGTGTITIENGGELRFAPTNTYDFTIGNQSTGVGVVRLNTGGTLGVAGVNIRYPTDTFILDGGTLVRNRAGNNTGFIRSTNGPGKFQIGPNGGMIDTSTGTQTVAIDIDDLPGSAGGTLVKTGSGTLVLNGGGTFSGGFTIEQGTLSIAASVNLPNWQTAPFVVKSGATIALGSGWTAADAATFQARVTVEAGGNVTYAGESTGDYVLDVAGSMTLSDPLNFSSRRFVKTGVGTLTLCDGNVFGGGVVVSNGTLVVDYAASGLADTHVTVAGAGPNTPAYLGVRGASFTPALAASGNGTVSFEKYAGVKGADSDLTVDFFGDGRAVKRGSAGFTITDIIIAAAPGHKATLVNMIDGNGGSWTLKGSSNGPLWWTGGFTNTASANSTTFYWNGDLILPGRPDGIPFSTKYFQARSGNVIFTNATVNMGADFYTGMGDGLAYVTFKDSVKTAGGGWDYIYGTTGTVLTVDNSSYQASRLNVGYNKAGRTGRLVITNNATVKVTGNEGFYMYSGWGDQYSGSMTVSQASYIGNDCITNDGRGPATYTLRSGAYTANGSFIVANGSRSDGTFVLSDGSLNLNAWTVIGNTTGCVGRLDISGGRITLKASGAVGNSTGSVGRVTMSGGDWFIKDGGNFQIGARGNGTFIQTGGDISLSAYPCVGRYPGGVGEYLLHGGTFTHRLQSDGKNLFFVAEEGTGTVSIANGGRLTTTNANGACVASKATSKGTLILSPGGTFEATRTYGGSGDDTVAFNGGAFKMLGTNYRSDFIPTSVNRAVVTPLGGEIDTAGKGDFTLARPLTAASRAEELSETLIHRWKFDGGSLEDCVGGATATVGGTVNWTNGAVRLLGTANGTSCINLGSDVLPTGGRGATIEMWVTQLERRQWARFVCAGPSSTFWLSSNRGGSSKDGWFVLNGATSISTHGGYDLENGKIYHMAVVFDQQPDDTWRFTVSMRDAATGELIDESTTTANASWSFAKITQSNGIWLGRSNATADPDPYADYHDVRIYNRAMTADQLAASCAAGPDAHFYLKKTGAGMLTMTGANTYKAGTAVDGGTLTLANGATIPATEMWAGAGATFLLNSTAQTVCELGGTGTVKGGTLSVTGTIQPGGRHAIGTLTVDGTSLQSGTLVADVATDGTSDCLAATGALNLSNLSLKLGNANLNEEKVYTLVTAAEIAGKFHEEDLPNRWRTFVQPTKVTLSYANGTVMLFR